MPMPALSLLGVPPATEKLCVFFARNPTARPTVRELQRTLGVASASAQRDLDRLVKGGALRVVVDGRLRRYAPRMDAPLWDAVRLLIAPPAPRPTSRVREAATMYGVDLGQLESMLKLSVQQRLELLDANAAFIAAARTSVRPGRG
jgi:hypothetical protein